MPNDSDKGARLPWRTWLEITIQAGVQAIPGVGGSLAHLWTAPIAERRFRRLERFFRDLADTFVALGADSEELRHRIDALSDERKEELRNLTEEVAERVVRETREEKVAWFRAFVAGALLDAEGWDLSDRLFFLSLLDRLTPAELHLLAFINQHGLRISVPEGSPQGEYRYNPKAEVVLYRNDGVYKKLPYSMERAGVYLGRLESEGLVTGIPQQVDTRSGHFPQPHQKSWHRTNDVGAGFIRCFAYPCDTGEE